MSEKQTPNNDTYSNSGHELERIGRSIVPSKDVKKTTPHKDHAIEIAIFSIVIIALIACGLWWLSAVDAVNSLDDETELIEIDDEDKAIDPVLNLLTQFGNIKMEGKLGAIPTTFEMNFLSDEGARYYSSSPVTRYTVKLRHADIDDDNNYHIVLTDYLEGRVAIGRFDGTLSNDGTTFSGKYTSSNGKVREFVFVQ